MRTEEKEKQIRIITEELIRQFFYKKSQGLELSALKTDCNFLTGDYLKKINTVLRKFDEATPEKSFNRLGVGDDFLNEYFNENNESKHLDFLKFIKYELESRKITRKIAEQIFSNNSVNKLDISSCGLTSDLLKKYLTLESLTLIEDLIDKAIDLILPEINSTQREIERLRKSAKNARSEEGEEYRRLTKCRIKELKTKLENIKKKSEEREIELRQEIDRKFKIINDDNEDKIGEDIRKLEVRIKRLDHHQIPYDIKRLEQELHKNTKTEIDKRITKLYGINALLSNLINDIKSFGMENIDLTLRDLLKGVSILSLEGNKLGSADFLVSYFPNLEKLSVAKNLLTDPHFFQAFENLETLKAGGNDFEDFSRFANLNLTALDLSGSSISGEDVKKIIFGNSNLEKLYLVETALEKIPLFDIANHPTLTDLDFRNNEGLQIDISNVDQVANNTQQRRISIVVNGHITTSDNFFDLRDTCNTFGVSLVTAENTKRASIVEGSVVDGNDPLMEPPFNPPANLNIIGRSDDVSALSTGGASTAFDTSGRWSTTKPPGNGRTSPIVEEKGSPKSSGTPETDRSSYAGNPWDSSSNSTDTQLTKPPRRPSNEFSDSQSEVAAALGGPPTNLEEAATNQINTSVDTPPKTPARSRSPLSQK